MSAQIVDGGPAFPSNDDGIQNEGMTLRDWFAGKETLADLDHPEATISAELTNALAGPRPDKTFAEDPIAWTVWAATVRAKLKYIRADAMLKARGGAA